MMANTVDLLKKFEQEHEVYVTADDTKFYWVVTARIPKKEETFHRTHRGKTYVSGLNQKGNVLVFPDSDLPQNYTLETWGSMNSFEEFVDKALERILAEKEENTQGLAEGCGTQCA
jgi:hypothetical protein